MLANAFKRKFESSTNKDIKEFLLSIPGSCDYKTQMEECLVHSVKVMQSPTTIIEVQSNGTDFLIVELT